jgi:hypothetical protein
MRRLVYNVIYSVVLINSSLLTIALYSSVRTTQNIQYLCSRYNRVRLYLLLVEISISYTEAAY